MSERTGWDRRLVVRASGKVLVGHAGAVLLRRCADRTGLTGALAKVLPSGGVGWRDRAQLVVQLAVSIALGATNLSEAEQLQLHHRPLFGQAASDSTAHRALAALDERAVGKITKARRRVRHHVWSLLHLRPGGFPWLSVAGRRLTGWIVIDIDATVITSASKKAGATVTFKKTFGFHPLAAWCANTAESLAMELRPGNAGANTVADHIRILADALAQIPHSSQAKILVRVDGAGATHGPLEHLEMLNTARRTVRYSVGWKMTESDEQAIARLPETAWETSLKQNGDLQEGYFIAELSDLNTREGWPEGMRLIVRRVKPSGRQLKKLTTFEQKTGWRYSITATNIRHMWGIAGSHQPQFLDVLHRSHASVEDRVRTNKAMGLHNLPSKSWEINRGWVLTANLAADLDAWVASWPCTTKAASPTPSPTPCAFGSTTCPPAWPSTPAAAGCRSKRAGRGQRRSRSAGTGSAHSPPSPDDGETPRRRPGRSRPSTPPGGVEPRRSRSDTRRPHPRSYGTNRANDQVAQAITAAEESRPTEARTPTPRRQGWPQSRGLMSSGFSSVPSPGRLFTSSRRSSS
ncbi:IS1380 family transposase [Streptomyces sp. MS1.AVA.4]|uniref:IS1380 family transposase n=1 Tax=Streptomyces pratisoli TaxID=3139917 RepID=A0ACC6QT35_9ACTN